MLGVGVPGDDFALNADALGRGVPFLAFRIVPVDLLEHGIIDVSLEGATHCDQVGVQLSGKPTFVATWPYHPDDGTPFDQTDPYGELGDLGWEEDGGEDATGGEEQP